MPSFKCPEILPQCLLAYLLLAVLQFAPISRAGGTPDSKFAIFQKFVNGETPIKEAVVYRTLRLRGKVVNRERWRFSLQDGGRSWYVRDLEPHNSNHNTDGASLELLWVVGDKSLHVVKKTRANGSGPYAHKFDRSLLWLAVFLGLPCEQFAIRAAPVKWMGNRFEVMQTLSIGHGKSTTRSVRGEVKLKEGRPCEIVDDNGRVLARYEYQGTNAIPKAWTADNGTVRFEFQRLELGTNALCGARGFLPGSFTKTSNLHAYVWTNDVAYGITDHGLWRTSDIVKAKPRRTGAIAMITIVAATFSFLCLYYLHRRKQKVKQ